MAIFTSMAGHKASTLTASQEVMKWLILNSDGNVVIQTFNQPHVMDPTGITSAARLYCEKCKAFKSFSFEAFRDENYLMREIQWAKDHKHGVVNREADTPTTNGERKLKVVL